MINYVGMEVEDEQFTLTALAYSSSFPSLPLWPCRPSASDLFHHFTGHSFLLQSQPHHLHFTSLFNMSIEEEIFHPITGVFLPLDIFTQEAIREGYTNWIDYLDHLDAEMENDGNEEEEETETIENEEKMKMMDEMRKADAEESNQSLVYSRECKVCFSSNPISRCIFTVCGHWSCLPCGIKIEREGTLSCPFCRTTTGWVRMIEECEEKRENDHSMSPSSSIYGEEDSYVLHPKTGEIISFEHLRQEGNMRGFEDPLAYLEFLDLPHYNGLDTDDMEMIDEEETI